MPHQVQLVPHPADGPGAALGLAVTIGRHAAGLKLDYRLLAPAAGLRLPLLPPLQPPGRADRLWEHTCFEAFVGVPGSTSYHEFNFAPSGRWAAYAFTAYRTGLQPLQASAVPGVSVVAASGELQVTAEVPAVLLPDPAGALRLGLAAVIEDAAGRRRHWALHHPAARPDFHAAAGFAVLLAPP